MDPLKMAPLSDSLFAIGATLVVGTSLFGWGTIVRRFVRLPEGTWPMSIVMGLAGLIFVGGLLNVSHLARPPVLYTLIAIGLAIAVKYLIERAAVATSLRAQQKKTDERIYLSVWLGIVALIGVIAAATQLLPSAFNHADDYQKYFVHVARMVQTGTVSGSPLNALGAETLGAQAFIQSFAVAIGGIVYVNMADAIFCFVLMLLLVGGAATGRPGAKSIAIIAIITVWVFEPQYVSVTALYSGAALVFAAIALSVDRREFSADFRDIPPASAIGLIYAALVALKPTFALFCLGHFLACMVGTIGSTRQIGGALKYAGATALWGILFVIPWVAVYAPLYLSALLHPTAGLAQRPTPAAETLKLLSTKQLFYGGSYAQYSFAVMVPLIYAVVALRNLKRWEPDVARLFGICAVLPIAYLVMLLDFGPRLAGYLTALRHFVPVLIGAVPATLVYLRVAADCPPVRKGRRTLVGEVLAILLAVWFLPDAVSRANILLRTGSMLAYLRNWSPAAIDALLAVGALRGDLRQHVAEQQERVPAGEPVLVWTAAPFLLDFNRNPIVDVDISGLSTPWRKTPRVSYVLWQYGGFGVRQPQDYAVQMRGPGQRETQLAANGWAYASKLHYLLTHSEIISNDGQTALMRVAPEMLLRRMGQDFVQHSLCWNSRHLLLPLCWRLNAKPHYWRSCTFTACVRPDLSCTRS